VVVDASVGGGEMVNGAAAITILWIISVLGIAVVVRRRVNRPVSVIRHRVDALHQGLPHESNSPPRTLGPFERLGQRIVGLLPARITDAVSTRTLGLVAVTTAAVALVSLSRALILIVVFGLACVARARKLAAEHQRALRREFPELVDLLGVALQSGRTLLHSIEFVCAGEPGELHQQLWRAAHSIDTGQRFVDALQQLAQSLPSGQSDLATLIRTLLSAERYGVSLPLALHELASDVRDLRRRQGEAEARRVPIRMLGPLVVLLLPSFALLTVAPLLASGLSSLRLAP
jgi:Type II secretion system (T2SS), protein F